jgi:hypothetical protein
MLQLMSMSSQGELPTARRRISGCQHRRTWGLTNLCISRATNPHCRQSQICRTWPCSKTTNRQEPAIEPGRNPQLLLQSGCLLLDRYRHCLSHNLPMTKRAEACCPHLGRCSGISALAARLKSARSRATKPLLQAQRRKTFFPEKTRPPFGTAQPVAEHRPSYTPHHHSLGMNNEQGKTASLQILLPANLHAASPSHL